MHLKINRNIITPVLLGGLMVVASTSEAKGYSFITLDNPYDPGHTYANGINDSGNVVGNSGGGFLFDGVSYTTIHHPSTMISEYNYTYAYGINNSGQVVGNYFNESLAEFGYVYKSGTYTSLNVPYRGRVSDINNRGQVVGSFHGFNDDYGYVYDGSTYITLAHPNATAGTYAHGINDDGLVVGEFFDDTGIHGYLFDGNTYMTIDDPEATGSYRYTYAIGINNSGQVVGAFRNDTGFHGFIFDGSTYTTIDAPEATSDSFVSGINNHGQVVGYFTNATGTHGFLASPTAVPLPGAIWLFCSGFVGFIGLNRRKSYRM